MSESALAYGREISEKKLEYLEVAATLVEATKINRGELNDKELITLIYELKPYYSKDKIKSILEDVRSLAAKYDLKLPS